MCRVSTAFVSGICLVLYVGVPTMARDSPFLTSKLLPPDSIPTESFGVGLSVEGDLAVVGAYDLQTLLLFRKTRGLWEWEANLGPFTDDFDRMTSSAVSMSQNRIAVPAGGGWFDAVVIFRQQGSSWIQEASILLDDPAWSTSLMGERLLVSHASTYPRGVVHCYTFEGTWEYRESLEPSLGSEERNFGRSLAQSAERALVGTDSGAAYVFEWDSSESTWSEQQRMTSSDANATFGTSVDLDGERLIVGAPRLSAPTSRAYVFQFDGTGFQEEAILAPPGDWMGYGATVAIDGDRAAVGSHYGCGGPGWGDPEPCEGAAYLYERIGSQWMEIRELLSDRDDPFERNMYGQRIVFDGESVFVGSVNDATRGPKAGAVDIFATTPIALHASEPIVSEGDALEFRAEAGRPGRPASLVLVAVDGVTVFRRLAVGVFGDDGRWSVLSTVPDNLEGLSATFRVVGFAADREGLQQTNATTVHFE